MRRPRPGGARFAPRTLPAKDPAAYVAANLRGATTRYQARVTVRVAAAELERRPYLWGTVTAIDEDSCEYRTSDDSLEWMALRIGMLGLDFEVHEPPELIAALRQLAARMTRAAGPA
jgi:predicted DNA-binding transcriptional regulator YafY